MKNKKTRTITLRVRIMSSLLIVILFLGFCMSFLGFFIVKKYILQRAQENVVKDLDVVRHEYYRQFDQMQIAFNMVKDGDDLGVLRRYLGLDYLYWIPKEHLKETKSEIVKKVIETAQDAGATRIIEKGEVISLKHDFKPIKIRSTPKAKAPKSEELESAMSLEYAKPYVDRNGNIEKVLVGGRLINKNDGFIDGIVNYVFDNKLYQGKPKGTVTVFQDGVRIATNVLDESGKRAIGTIVSDVVYSTVVEKGKKWLHKAFVVTDWYFTAYEPIKNINGDIIGMLYVGNLEKPFNALQRNLFFALITIIILASLFTMFFSYFIYSSISIPLDKVLRNVKEISEGKLETKIVPGTSIKELDHLINAFNDMSQRLSEREESLEISNEKLAILNKRYLDLIGFVAHELKGILSSVVLNTYLFKKEILGPINEKQRKTLMSMARNLDYLTVTVKNFLNLSRIEKNELQVTKTEVRLKEHVFDPSIDAFKDQAHENKMVINNNIPDDLNVIADSGLLQIVANNLISNAIKYGKPQGEINLSARNKGHLVEVEIYNDGEPMASTDIEKLFKKFSRVIYRGMESVKGTGIGLFITKEIIKQHGGEIRVEPREKGNAFIFEIDNN